MAVICQMSMAQCSDEPGIGGEKWNGLWKLAEMLEELQGSIYFEKKLSASNARHCSTETNQRRYGQLSIPRWFVKEHGDKFRRDVILQFGVSSRSWLHRLSFCISREVPEVTFAGGRWSTFVASNGLVEGDQLVFSLTAMSRFQVYMFDAHGNSKAPQPLRRPVMNLKPRAYYNPEEDEGTGFCQSSNNTPELDFLTMDTPCFSSFSRRITAGNVSSLTEKCLAGYKGQGHQQEDQEIDIKKHQVEAITELFEEKKKSEKKLQQQRKKLQEKQWRELESQLQREKSKKARIYKAKKQEIDLEKEYYVQKISELKEKLDELKEEADDADEMVKILTTSQRQVNYEVEEARAVILESEMLVKYGTSEIGVKRLGELNTEGWYEVCKDKFKTPYTFQKWVSNMENMLTKHDFNPPLKAVPDGNTGKMKYAIDEADETLTKLQNKYGPVVANAVGAAALEIENWNSSGRFIIPMPWDFKADKKASMSQIFQLFAETLKAKEQEVEEKDRQLQALQNTSKKTPTPAPKRKRTLRNAGLGVLPVSS